MNYHIVARPTRYNGVQFRSRLEARWAAFFDLIEWDWKYEPIDFEDWTPDFYISFPCGHSECSDKHEFYAEVKPYLSVKQFENHPVASNFYGTKYGLDGGLMLGNDPSVAEVDFCHGAGGGVWDGHNLFQNWARVFVGSSQEVENLWREAGNRTQWRGSNLPHSYL